MSTVIHKLLCDSERRPSGVWLLIGLAVIWLVTAYDCFCCQWLTIEQELNPIAAYVFLNYGSWGLVAAKIVGTFLATEALRCLPWFYLASIVTFQIGLALFLGFA